MRSCTILVHTVQKTKTVQTVVVLVHTLKVRDRLVVCAESYEISTTVVHVEITWADLSQFGGVVSCDAKPAVCLFRASLQNPSHPMVG
jgi:hypothetical protein